MDLLKHGYYIWSAESFMIDFFVQLLYTVDNTC